MKNVHIMNSHQSALMTVYTRTLIRKTRKLLSVSSSGKMNKNKKITVGGFLESCFRL